MGPVVTAVHKAKIESYIEDGAKAGANWSSTAADSRRQGTRRAFSSAARCSITSLRTCASIKEEIFGPVLCVVRVPDLASAIELINKHEFGNGVSCYTSDGGTAREFARRVQVGMVGINVPIPVPMAWHSFGGWKRSSFSATTTFTARKDSLLHALQDIMQRWPAGEPARIELSYTSGTEGDTSTEGEKSPGRAVRRRPRIERGDELARTSFRRRLFQSLPLPDGQMAAMLIISRGRRGSPRTRAKTTVCKAAGTRRLPTNL